MPERRGFRDQLARRLCQGSSFGDLKNPPNELRHPDFSFFRETIPLSRGLSKEENDPIPNQRGRFVDSILVSVKVFNHG
jgi:hypothetical protein